MKFFRAFIVLTAVCWGLVSLAELGTPVGTKSKPSVSQSATKSAASVRKAAPPSTPKPASGSNTPIDSGEGIVKVLKDQEGKKIQDENRRAEIESADKYEAACRAVIAELQTAKNEFHDACSAANLSESGGEGEIQTCLKSANACIKEFKQKESDPDSNDEMFDKIAEQVMGTFQLPTAQNSEKATAIYKNKRCSVPKLTAKEMLDEANKFRKDIQELQKEATELQGTALEKQQEAQKQLQDIQAQKAKDDIEEANANLGESTKKREDSLKEFSGYQGVEAKILGLQNEKLTLLDQMAMAGAMADTKAIQLRCQAEVNKNFPRVKTYNMYVSNQNKNSRNTAYVSCAKAAIQQLQIQRESLERKSQELDLQIRQLSEAANEGRKSDVLNKMDKEMNKMLLAELKQKGDMVNYEKVKSIQENAQNLQQLYGRKNSQLETRQQELRTRLQAIESSLEDESPRATKTPREVIVKYSAIKGKKEQVESTCSATNKLNNGLGRPAISYQEITKGAQ